MKTAPPRDSEWLGSLQGVRVLDLTTYLPGPYATMLMADLGADVIQVEPSTGDPGRHVPPRHRDSSALHQWVARGKRSVSLDLKLTSDHDVFMNLVRGCDVVFEGFTPGVAERLAVSYSDCVDVKPDIVYCSISGLGHDYEDGRSPGHEINFAARAGLLDQVRDSVGAPVAIGPPLADLSGGLHAAVGVLAALRHRDRTGQGQFVDVSLMGSALALAGPQLVKQWTAEPVAREHDHNLGADPAYRTYAARDGRHLALGGLEAKFWTRLCEVIDRPDLRDLRVLDPGRAAEELSKMFAAKDRCEWDELLEDAGVCYSPVNTVGEVGADRHVVGRGDLDVSLEGDVSLRNPIRLSATRSKPTGPAPALSASSRSDWLPRNPA